MLLSAALLLSCGGAAFKRAKGSKRYRPLPKGFKVVSAESVDGLSTPIEVLGTLSVSDKTTELEADQGKAKATLSKAAARVGCDAVVGTSVKTSSKKIKKRVRTKDASGAVVVQVKTVPVYTHKWTAKCVRTAKAPKAAPRYTRRRRPRPRPSTVAKARAPKPQSQSQSQASAAPSTARQPAPSAPAAVAVKPPAAPPAATEVARAVLLISRAFQKNNTKALCKYFDPERVYFDLSSRDPSFRFTKDLSGPKACESLSSGKLATYIQEFGPAEIHSNPAILIPSLFRVHGGAYLGLSAEERVDHRKRLQTLRAGKQQIACDMYWVIAADNLFTVHLECAGVNAYELFLRRDGVNDFKLMRVTHKR